MLKDYFNNIHHTQSTEEYYGFVNIPPKSIF